ncbi:MAG: hypothetical protein KGO96_07530 [Elusimicrobia bacterium]|nr:hypothetical protein [Elusimicrobiota bacterium]
MPRHKGIGNKDNFDSLSKEWMDAVSVAPEDEINKRISEIAKAQAELDILKKVDPELLSAKESYDNLMEPYRIDSKENKLKIKFAYKVLKDRGRA